MMTATEAIISPVQTFNQLENWRYECDNMVRTSIGLSYYTYSYIQTYPKLKRFDDGVDVVFIIIGDWNEKGNLRVKPRMDHF